MLPIHFLSFLSLRYVLTNFLHSFTTFTIYLISNLNILLTFLACNAAETLLLHESTIESGLADKILRALRIAGVTLYGY